jgi:hypothetical protein
MNNQQEKSNKSWLGSYTVEIPVNSDQSNKQPIKRDNLDRITIEQLRRENECLNKRYYELSNEIIRQRQSLFSIVAECLPRILFVGAVAAFITLLIRPNHVKTGAYIGAWMGLGICFIERE